jgi:hypothetical protein
MQASYSAAWLNVVISTWSTNLAFDLQLQIITQTALSQEVQTRARTRTKAKCLLKNLRRKCHGKGRMPWTNPKSKLTPAYFFDQRHKRAKNWLSESYHIEGLYPVPRRAYIRAWFRGYEHLINQLEKVVIDSTICQKENPDYEREWYWGFGRDCLRRGSKVF